MQKIHTEKAPAAVGPYSQAVVVNGLVYTSGQIALDPATGELVGNTIEEQAEQVMKNLTAVLAAAGSNPPVRRPRVGAKNRFPFHPRCGILPSVRNPTGPSNFTLSTFHFQLP